MSITGWQKPLPIVDTQNSRLLEPPPSQTLLVTMWEEREIWRVFFWQLHDLAQSDTYPSTDNTFDRTSHVTPPNLKGAGSASLLLHPKSESQKYLENSNDLHRYKSDNESKTEIPAFQLVNFCLCTINASSKAVQLLLGARLCITVFQTSAPLFCDQPCPVQPIIYVRAGNLDSYLLCLHWLQNLPCG